MNVNSAVVEPLKMRAMRPLAVSHYEFLTPRHVGYLEHPQNEWPTFDPRLAVRLTMPAPQLGHSTSSGLGEISESARDDSVSAPATGLGGACTDRTKGRMTSISAGEGLLRGMNDQVKSGFSRTNASRSWPLIFHFVRENCRPLSAPLSSQPRTFLGATRRRFAAST